MSIRYVHPVSTTHNGCDQVRANIKGGRQLTGIAQPPNRAKLGTIARSSNRPLAATKIVVGRDQNERNALLNRRRQEYEQALQLNRRDLRQWIRYADLEIEAGLLNHARSIYERALAVDYTFVPLWYRYAQAEAKFKNFDNARAVLERALRLLPLEPKLWLTLLEYEEIRGNLEFCWTVFEKWHGTGSQDIWQPWQHFARRHANSPAIRLSEADIIELRTRSVPADAEFEDLALTDLETEMLKTNGRDIELWWLSLDENPSQDIFELAVKHCRPTQNNFKDSRWRMYALLWLRFAIFVETQDLDTKRVSATDIYERALSSYEHSTISSVTLWMNYLAYLVRQHAPLAKCRQLLGTAIGKTRQNESANPRIIREYIKFETKVDEIERVRKLFGILCSNWPQRADSWNDYAQFEAKVFELERATALWELALQLDLDHIDSVWSDYIDYTADHIGIEEARRISQRALHCAKINHKAQLVAKVAMFELGLGMYNSEDVPDEMAVITARDVFEKGLKALKGQDREDVFDLYTQFEESYGDETTSRQLSVRAPKFLATTAGAGVNNEPSNDMDIQEEEILESNESEAEISIINDLSSADSPLGESSTAGDGSLQNTHQPTALGEKPAPSSAIARLLANAQKWKSQQSDAAHTMEG